MLFKSLIRVLEHVSRQRRQNMNVCDASVTRKCILCARARRATRNTYRQTVKAKDRVKMTAKLPIKKQKIKLI